MGKIRDVYDALIGKNPGETDKREVIEQKSLISTLEGVVNEQLYSMGMTSNVNPYSTNYVVHRATNLVADSLAQLPLRIYRGQDPMPPEFDLPGSFSLTMPNPNMTLYEIIYRSVIYYLNKGDLFIEVEYDPKLMWSPINPSHMTQQKNGNWKYQSGSNSRIILPENLIHLAYFNPNSDKYSANGKGLSPIQVVKEEISNDNKAREYNAKYFENFGKVGVLLKNIAGNASEEQMKKIVDQFNAAHAGSKKAWKAMGLPDGIDYEEFAQNMRDMEFSQGRVDNRDRILAILGVHKALLGATDSVDRAVADAAMRQLYIHTVKPLSVRLQQAINLQFMRSHFPAYICKYDFSDVAELKEAQNDKVTRAKSYRDLGYTMNEINDMLDLEMDEVTDPVGDMRFVPNSLIPTTDLLFDEILPTKSVNTSPKLGKLVEFIVKGEKETEKKTSIGSYVRYWTKLQRSSNRKIKSKVSKHFSDQLGKVLNIIHGNGKSVSKDINEILIMTEIKNLITEDKKALVSSLLPTYQEVSKASSELAIGAMKLNIPPRIKDDIVNSMVNKITTIDDSSYKLFMKELKQSTQLGETIAQLAERAQKVGKFNTGYAATRVARTESSKLINACTIDEYKTNGVEMKSVSTAHDDQVRDTHAQNAADGAIDMNQAFSGTGEQYPGESEINCRCCLIPVIK